MRMESYNNNTKTTKEGKTVPLKFPFPVEKGRKHAEGGESEVWEIYTSTGEGPNAHHVVLKVSKDEAFATKEEMQNSEEFYKFLKNFPGFGKFVPDTIYFKAQETEEGMPKAFCIQQFIKGERIDRLKDDVIYKEAEIVRQLLELIDASIKVIHTIRENKGQYPDFMRTPEKNNLRVVFGSLLLNPRYSSNILIADEPNASGQRVWFVDTGINANARRQKGWEWKGRHTVNSVIEKQFNAWKKKLERSLAKLK